MEESRSTVSRKGSLFEVFGASLGALKLNACAARYDMTAK